MSAGQKRTPGDIPLRTAVISETSPKADTNAKSLRAAMGIRTAAQSGGKSKTGWCTVDGCRIAWEQYPASTRSGHPLVCLHDAGGGSREFRPLLKRLPGGAGLLLFDWPGHGRSEDLSGDSHTAGLKLTVEYGAAILQNLMQQLGIEKPVLLGSGFGAAAAMRFALDHPDRPMGLVLCEPAGLVPSSNGGPFSQKGRRGVRTLLRDLKQFSPIGNFATPAYTSAKRQILRLAALLTIMQGARSTARLSLERASPGLRTGLESLACPTLFALSRNNREFPLRKYLDLLDPSLAWVPQHQFTVFAGAFHPLWDEPERFAQALSGFLQAQLPLESHTHAWLISAVDYPTRNMNTWQCVHPDCGAERVLPVGSNANESK